VSCIDRWCCRASFLPGEKAPTGHVVAVGACAGGGCNAVEHEARTAELSDAGPPEDDVPRRRPAPQAETLPRTRVGFHG
jgi:hypothetical protein